MSTHRFVRFGTVLTLVLLVAGCSSLLPKSKTESAQFQTFDEARLAIESLVPSQSNLTTLAAMGIDPAKQPNTLILTYSDVARQVLNGNTGVNDGLDKGIVTCLQAGEACRGWEFTASRILKARTGNFWGDFANFKRTTEISGWRFKALILLVNDTVVYRAWGGQPFVRDVEVQSNPLGPLQESGPALINSGR